MPTCIHIASLFFALESARAVRNPQKNWRNGGERELGRAGKRDRRPKASSQVRSRRLWGISPIALPPDDWCAVLVNGQRPGIARFLTPISADRDSELGWKKSGGVVSADFTQARARLSQVCQGDETKTVVRA